MKILSILLLLALCAIGANSQSTLPLRADTVVIEKVGGNANLKLKDASRDTLGVYTNIGGGVMRAKKPRKLNDSTFTIGNDTISLRGNSGSGSSLTNATGTGDTLLISSTIKRLEAGYGINHTVSSTKIITKVDTSVIATQYDLTQVGGSQNIQQVLTVGDTSLRKIYFKDTATGDHGLSYMFLQPKNYGTTYGSRIAQRFNGWSTAEFNGVNADGRPNVVGTIWSYNHTPGGGRESSSEASFAFRTETHFGLFSSDPAFEFHMPEVTTAPGMTFRPNSYYILKESGLTYLNQQLHKISYKNQSNANIDWMTIGDNGGGTTIEYISDSNNRRFEHNFIMPSYTGSLVCDSTGFQMVFNNPSNKTWSTNLPIVYGSALAPSGIDGYGQVILREGKHTIFNSGSNTDFADWQFASVQKFNFTKDNAVFYVPLIAAGNIVPISGAKIISDSGDPLLLSSSGGAGSDVRFLNGADATRTMTLFAATSGNRTNINIGPATTNPSITLKVQGSARIDSSAYVNMVDVVSNVDSVLTWDRATGKVVFAKANTAAGSGLSSLNGLGAGTQFFAVDGAGTDIAWNSATATHTLSVPDASATARGAITTGTQTIGGPKTFNNDLNINGANAGIGGGGFVSNTRFGNGAGATWSGNLGNTAMGETALGACTDSYFNTAYGRLSLASLTTGANLNSAFGHFAGNLATGSGNVFLGYSAGSALTTGDNQLFIANNSTSTLIWGPFANNRVVIGSPGTPTDNTVGTLQVRGKLTVDAHTIASNSDSGVIWDRSTNEYKVAKINGIGTNIMNSSLTATGSYTQNLNHNQLKFDSALTWYFRSKETDGTRKIVNLFMTGNSFSSSPILLYSSMRNAADNNDSLLIGFRTSSLSSKAFSIDQGKNISSEAGTGLSAAWFARIITTNGRGLTSSATADTTTLKMVAADSMLIKGVTPTASADSMLVVTRQNSDGFNKIVKMAILPELVSTVSTYTNYTTTATYENVASITLTAGDWDISAFYTYSSNSATITAASNAVFVISTTTASAAGATEGLNISYVPQAALLGTSKFSDAITPYRVSPGSTTTYYLNSQATFTLGNPQYVGTLRAVKIK